MDEARIQTNKAFLASVVEFNEQFNALRAGKNRIALAHSFWSEAEIDRAAAVKKDWGVPVALVPFYGDWHTLICLNPQTGAVELLGDDRQLMFTWPSVSEFVSCLVSEPETPTDLSDVIEGESWLDF